MGQGMTKKQQIAAHQLTANQPYTRNQGSARIQSGLERPKNQNQLTLTLAETNSDQTFTSISARQFGTYAASKKQYLTVEEGERERDASCGHNSSTHGEGKHEITVNRTKTPKLGIHMRSVLNNCANKKSISSVKINQDQSTKLLQVPGLTRSNLQTSQDTAMLSTRNMTSSARSLESGSFQRLHSQESGNMSDCVGNRETEAQLFSMTPNEVMQFRWLKELRASIPSADLADIEAVLADPQAGRQFAAEYSQSSYQKMFQDDYAIGDYLRSSLSEPHSAFSYSDRERLISIVQDLHKKKEYKQETLHLAGSIADRYLSIILAKGRRVPSLFTLGATVMLMAAKLEQPISPSFNRMLALLPQSEQKRISKQDLINLEEDILLTLQFSIHFAGPIPFIERFQRLLGIDQEISEHDFKQVGFTARQFCKYMQRYGQFLEWKPSQIAAAAFMLSINLNLSPVGSQVGLKPLRGQKINSLASQDINSRKTCATLAFQFWTKQVARLTFIDANKDIAEPYVALMEHLDTFQFKNKMRSDESLWVQLEVDCDSRDESMSTERMIEEELAAF